MAAVLPALDRSRSLAALAGERFDLVIIGGGITGAGLAYAATSLGLRVALLEAHDFAAGTSSRSTKLIHGGLRYLAQGEIRLVRETALERKEIHRRAPHLAEPRWVVLPARTRTSRLRLRVGLSLYETLGAVAARDRHRNWSASELEREEPLFRRDRYPVACAYREYMTDDARLVLANLRAAAARGACALNYAVVDGLLLERDVVCGVRASTPEGALEVRGRCVVNAAGPWVEAVRRLETPSAPSWLHLSKGIHITLPVERLPVRYLYMLEARDGRLLFVIPRGRVVYVGTTDTTYARGPELWPHIERAEVEYLLEPLARYFDVPELAPGDVVGAWAGLRPLIAEPGRSPTELSRRDEVVVGPSRLVSIAGGKLTGYRPMARAVLAHVADVLGTSLPAPRDDEPLPGGAFDGDLERLAHALLEVSPAASSLVRARLARLYGSEARDVLQLGDAALPGASCAVTGEVDWAVRHEMARTLEDLVYRRLRLAIDDPQAADAVDALGARMGQLLGWSDAQRASQIVAARARLGADLRFEIGVESRAPESLAAPSVLSDPQTSH
jgi:glycerol-3-phosphate dehydrogenase